MGSPNIVDLVWARIEEVFVEVKCSDVLAALAVSRLSLRHFSRDGKWPKHSEFCRQARSRVGKDLLKTIQMKLEEVVEDERDKLMELSPLPWEGISLSDEQHASRVRAYAMQWEALLLRSGRDPMLGEENRRGPAPRGVVCLTKMKVFPSAREAARWMNEIGHKSVVAGHIRTALSHGRKLAGMEWAYATDVVSGDSPVDQLPADAWSQEAMIA